MEILFFIYCVILTVLSVIAYRSSAEDENLWAWPPDLKWLSKSLNDIEKKKEKAKDRVSRLEERIKKLQQSPKNLLNSLKSSFLGYDYKRSQQLEPIQTTRYDTIKKRYRELIGWQTRILQEIHKELSEKRGGDYRALIRTYWLLSCYREISVWIDYSSIDSEKLVPIETIYDEVTDDIISVWVARETRDIRSLGKVTKRLGEVLDEPDLYLPSDIRNKLQCKWESLSINRSKSHSKIGVSRTPLPASPKSPISSLLAKFLSLANKSKTNKKEKEKKKTNKFFESYDLGIEQRVGKEWKEIKERKIDAKELASRGFATQLEAQKYDEESALRKFVIQLETKKYNEPNWVWRTINFFRPRSDRLQELLDEIHGRIEELEQDKQKEKGKTGKPVDKLPGNSDGSASNDAIDLSETPPDGMPPKPDLGKDTDQGKQTPEDASDSSSIESMGEAEETK